MKAVFPSATNKASVRAMEMLVTLREALGEKFVLTGEDTEKWRLDWTGNYTADPIAVVRPANTAEVSAVMAVADATGTAVVPVGGNTGLTGATSGTGMIMLSLDRLNDISRIDTAGRTATVGAGVVLANLHAAADVHDLIFPLTFGAKGSAMIGGVLSTNAGGSNVLRYGNTRDLCLGLEVVMADGRVMNLMSALHKDNSGLNLKHLMIGAEGTLGIITGAILKLFPKPRAYATAMVAVERFDQALTLLYHLQDNTGGAVEAFEYMPRAFIEKHLRQISGSRAPFEQTHDINVMVEIATTSRTEATPGPDGQTPLVGLLEDTLAEMLTNGDLLDAVIAQTEGHRREMWARREASAELTFTGEPLVDTDVAVPLDCVTTFLEQANARTQAIDPGCHDLTVAHLGDGNLHYSVYVSRADAALKQDILTAVEDVVEALNGSFSAEHGVGVSKLSTLQRRKDPVAISAMQAIKAALDPKGILNPGKVIPDQ